MGSQDPCMKNHEEIKVDRRKRGEDQEEGHREDFVGLPDRLDHVAWGI